MHVALWEIPLVLKRLIYHVDFQLAEDSHEISGLIFPKKVIDITIFLSAVVMINNNNNNFGALKLSPFPRCHLLSHLLIFLCSLYWKQYGSGSDCFQGRRVFKTYIVFNNEL